MGTFAKSNEIGKAGEDVLSRYWYSQGYEVVDLSSNKTAQGLDIDYAISTHRGSYLCDVKSDTHSQNNFFIEIVSNCNTQSLGCAYVSKADRWYYYFPNDDMCYVFSPSEMVEYIEKHSHRRVTTSTYGNNGKVLYNTIGVLVPIRDCPVVKTCFKPLEVIAANSNETH